MSADQGKHCTCNTSYSFPNATAGSHCERKRPKNQGVNGSAPAGSYDQCAPGWYWAPDVSRCFPCVSSVYEASPGDSDSAPSLSSASKLRNFAGAVTAMLLSRFLPVFASLAVPVAMRY